jgi:hypothetical protein
MDTMDLGHVEAHTLGEVRLPREVTVLMPGHELLSKLLEATLIVIYKDQLAIHLVESEGACPAYAMSGPSD